MKRINPPTESAGAPHKELHIYYLKGRVAPGTDLSAAGFIGNWEEDGFSFLFYDRDRRERIDALLSEQPRLGLIDAYRMTYAEWLGENPTTFRVGGFEITPPWENRPQDGRQTKRFRRLILYPGVVFGSGSHSTTRDCLRALEILYTEATPRMVLDLGTGTGVLALAAAALGSPMTLAVDLNSLAARTAGHNVRLNNMQNRILAVQSRAESMIDIPADLLVANIHYDVMRQLVNSSGFRQKKRFVLSGLLRSQVQAIETELARAGASVERRWNGDGIWYTVSGANGGA